MTNIPAQNKSKRINIATSFNKKKILKTLLFLLEVLVVVPIALFVFTKIIIPLAFLAFIFGSIGEAADDDDYWFWMWVGRKGF